MPSKPPSGFVRDFAGREAPAIGVFGAEGSGKTRFCATATQYAAERNQIPGWLVCDRKTRKTVREVHAELDLDLPYIQKEDFISQAQALEIAKLDRESDADNAKIQKIYTEVIRKVITAATELGATPEVNPIIIETGTQVWDWISFSHFGRKQGVGKSRVWGPPKQDWTDLMDALSHKTLLLTFWEKDAYKGEERAGYTRPDGPPHVGYTLTTQIRLNFDQKKKLGKNETHLDRFSLDVYESQDNVALAGMDAVLTADAISYGSLMNMLRPEE